MTGGVAGVTANKSVKVWMEREEKPETYDDFELLDSGALLCITHGGCNRYYSPLAWHTVESHYGEQEPVRTETTDSEERCGVDV